jgi:hypothetical protein
VFLLVGWREANSLSITFLERASGLVHHSSPGPQIAPPSLAPLGVGWVDVEPTFRLCNNGWQCPRTDEESPHQHRAFNRYFRRLTVIAGDSCGVSVCFVSSPISAPRSMWTGRRSDSASLTTSHPGRSARSATPPSSSSGDTPRPFCDE